MNTSNWFSTIKGFKLVLLLLFLASPILLFSFYRPAIKSDFKAEFMAEPTEERVRVEVDKSPASILTVQVMDGGGRVLHSETLGNGLTSGEVIFNTHNLPDGHYRLDLFDGHTTQRSDINLVLSSKGVVKEIAISPVE